MTARSSYIPPYIKDNLKWYEKEGLITYFQQREYQEFKKDRDAYINETKILNFDIIHHMCRGDKLEKTIKEHNTVKKEKLKQMPPSEKYAGLWRLVLGPPIKTLLKSQWQKNIFVVIIVTSVGQKEIG